MTPVSGVRYTVRPVQVAPETNLLHRKQCSLPDVACAEYLKTILGVHP